MQDKFSVIVHEAESIRHKVLAQEVQSKKALQAKELYYNIDKMKFFQIG
jgi:hypothetical protein